MSAEEEREANAGKEENPGNPENLGKTENPERTDSPVRIALPDATMDAIMSAEVKEEEEEIDMIDP